MSDYDDYNEGLFFEPDYSVYKTARKLIKLSEERDLMLYKHESGQLSFIEFQSIIINVKDRTIVTYGCEECIVKAKSNKHLYDIIEVLTRP